MDPRTDNNLLHSIDFSAVEEMDPALADGHSLIFDREVPFELRTQDVGSGPQEVGTLEAVKTKVLYLGHESSPQHIRVELTSENDLFFHYIHSVEEGSFRRIQESQKLMIDFGEYPSVLIRMLNSCVKEPHNFLAVFIMHRDGKAHLDFIQNIEYKFIELLSLDFMASTEEMVRQQLTYRYNAAKSKLAITQARLLDITSMVKLKNPSLLLQIQKGAGQQKSVNRSYR